MLAIEENCILEAIHGADREAVSSGLAVGFCHEGSEVLSLQLVLLKMKFLHLQWVFEEFPEVCSLAGPFQAWSCSVGSCPHPQIPESSEPNVTREKLRVLLPCSLFGMGMRTGPDQRSQGGPDPIVVLIL